MTRPLTRWLARTALAFLIAAPLLASTQSFAPKIPDVEVVTQDGKTVRFHSDLVKGNTVAVNFIFTNCKTICPVLGAMFTNLQKEGGRGVRMISVSIDPGFDTPRRLKEWSTKFGAGPSWTLVTGRQSDIDAIVKAFGVYTARPQDHLPVTIIGNDATGIWTRNYGFLGTSEISAVLTRVNEEGRGR